MKRIRNRKFGYQQLENRRLLATLALDGGVAHLEPVTKVQHEPLSNSQQQKSKKFHDEMYQPVIIVDCWFGHEMTKEVLMDCWNNVAETKAGF